jgi:hypothetical protein
MGSNSIFQVGAGLMFVLMHGEVSAKGEASKPESFVCDFDWASTDATIVHCETKTLDCAMFHSGCSCVKKGIF